MCSVFMVLGVCVNVGGVIYVVECWLSMDVDRCVGMWCTMCGML